MAHQQPQTQRRDELGPGSLQRALSGAADGVGDEAITYVGGVPPGRRDRTGGRHIYSTAQVGTRDPDLSLSGLLAHGQGACVEVPAQRH